MKPNGKHFVVRAVLFVLCAVSLLSAIGNAETVHGKFKLVTETRWGKLLLAPGEYEFTISDTASIRVVTVRSRDSGWSALILPESTSDPSSAQGTSLQLVKSEGGAYIRSLALGDLGMTLNFGAPIPGKVIRLVLPQDPQVAPLPDPTEPGARVRDRARPWRPRPFLSQEEEILLPGV